MMPVADAQARAILVKVPGTSFSLEYEREPNGRLLRLSGGGRTYLEEHEAARIFDGGWLRVSEGSIEHGFLRFVEASYGSWIEEYRWDSDGYPIHIDGVDIRRDADHHVIGCHGQGVEWGYGYSANHLAVVDGPAGTQYITRGEQGQPIRLRQGDKIENLTYGKDGVRLGIEPAPSNWNRDSLGRLWTISDSHQRVLHTF